MPPIRQPALWTRPAHSIFRLHTGVRLYTQPNSAAVGRRTCCGSGGVGFPRGSAVIFTGVRGCQPADFQNCKLNGSSIAHSRNQHSSVRVCRVFLAWRLPLAIVELSTSHCVYTGAGQEFELSRPVVHDLGTREGFATGTTNCLVRPNRGAMGCAAAPERAVHQDREGWPLVHHDPVWIGLCRVAGGTHL